jgi:prepilin signal peptidase PulO-like enzyme (type II secretory pathway)
MSNISNHISAPTIGALVVVAALMLMMCPIPFLMLTSSQMVLVSLAALGFITWVTFQWQEQATDEREELHRFLAARLAYFVGAGILMIGVLVQSLQHSVDPWLVGALIGMIAAKIFSKSIAEKYN